MVIHIQAVAHLIIALLKYRQNVTSTVTKTKIHVSVECFNSNMFEINHLKQFLKRV
jgi:hypothetical protein